MSSIGAKDIEIRVSSVLNKDVKQFGKQYLLDGRDDTCWQSDQGNNQWIECRLKEEVRIKEIRIQFQGGFASKQIAVQYLNPENNLFSEIYLYANDSNDLQIFNDFNEIKTNRLKILFNDCSDFFGRIIVYNFEIIK